MKQIVTSRDATLPYASSLEVFYWTPHLTHACPVSNVTRIHSHIHHLENSYRGVKDELHRLKYIMHEHILQTTANSLQP